MTIECTVRTAFMTSECTFRAIVAIFGMLGVIAIGVGFMVVVIAILTPSGSTGGPAHKSPPAPPRSAWDDECMH